MLSGIPIRDQESAWANLQWFHSRGVRTVIITSMQFPAAGQDPLTSANDLPIQVMASTIADQNDPYPTRYAHMSFQKVPTYFSGTGDLTTALLLAWLLKTRDQERERKGNQQQQQQPPAGVFSFDTLVSALELTMATLQAVIHRTASAPSEELLLIQSKADIERPNVTQRATVVDAAQIAAAARAKQTAQ